MSNPSNPQTFYDEWIHRPLREESYPLIPYALWETVRWGRLDTQRVEVANAAGLLEDDGDVKRLRRVYPPGSVLPEPRQTTPAELAAIDWPCWAVFKHRLHWSTFWRGEILLDHHPKELITVYPVQQLANGTFTPVPWSAVECKK